MKNNIHLETMTFNYLFGKKEEVLQFEDYIIKSIYAPENVIKLITKEGENKEKVRTFDGFDQFYAQYTKCINWAMKNKMSKSKNVQKNTLVKTPPPTFNIPVQPSIDENFTFNEATTKQFADEVRDALKQIAEKYGVKYNGTNVSYLPSKLSGTFSFSSTNYDAINKEYKLLFERYDLPHNVFGSEITYDGKVLKIVDYKTRNRKAPFILEDVNTGKSYKVDIRFIQNYLK